MAQALRVLFVEDSQDDALLLLFELKKGGYAPTYERVETYEAMQTTLDQAQWDLILADYDLPKFNGIDALMLAKKTGLDLPFIIVSGRIGEETAVEAMKAGAHDYIFKNNLARLIPAVKRELGDAQVRRERKQAEEGLRKSEQLIHSTLDSLGSNIAILDEGGFIQYTNRAWINFARQNDYQGDPAMVGLNYLMVCDTVGACGSDDAETALEAAQGIRDVLTGHRKEFFLEYPCHGPQEQRWFTMRATPFLDKSPICVVVSHENITEHRRAEEQLQKKQAELAHALRLATMGEMATTLAHELNQPLCAILSFAQTCMDVLKTGSLPKEELLPALREIAAQADLAGKIIQHVRHYSRKNQPKRLPIDLNQIIRNSIHFIESKIKQKKVKLKLQLSDRIPLLKADEIQIEQVLLNLSQNALEATEGMKDRRLEIQSTLLENDQVLVLVKDNGIGSQEPERLYEPFFTTKPEGLGLGLPISRSIIENHGGKLWNESNPDRGMTFYFTLPLRVNEK